MGVKAASESFLVVAFHNLVFDIGLIFFVQVVEDHGGEQACDTGADDANLKGIGTLFSLGIGMLLAFGIGTLLSLGIATFLSLG